MLSLENIESRFEKIVSSEEWKLLQEKYNSSEHILMFGHGGNMAVADHAAIDGSRLTDKNIIAPGSGILSTSIIADTNFNDWIMNWVKIRTRGLDSNKCMAIGFSCSLNNPSSSLKNVTIKFLNDKGDFIEKISFKIPSLGTEIINAPIYKFDFYISINSRIPMLRPNIFKFKNNVLIDVFHG